MVEIAIRYELQTNMPGNVYCDKKWFALAKTFGGIGIIFWHCLMPVR